MAYDFDGTNDALINNNGLSGVDSTLQSTSIWLNWGASTFRTFYMLATAISGGAWTSIMESWGPLAAGDFRIAVYFKHGTANAVYVTADDYDVDTWYHVVVTYDRSAVSTPPVLYVDGSSVTLNENTAASGAATTGTDSLIIGENVGRGADLNGRIAEFAHYSAVLDISEVKSLTKGFSPKLVRPSALELYFPLLNDWNDAQQGAALTADSGVPTLYAHPRNIIQPSRRQIFVPTAAAAGGVFDIFNSGIIAGAA